VSHSAVWRRFGRRSRVVALAWGLALVSVAALRPLDIQLPLAAASGVSIEGGEQGALISGVEPLSAGPASGEDIAAFSVESVVDRLWADGVAQPMARYPNQDRKARH
jgi:hypothetical protein